MVRFLPIISAEHATNHVPPVFAGLGLTAEDLAGHHAWDAGAGYVARILADQLEAEIWLGENSRLVADLNRPPDLPEVVPAVAFGLVVPGNQDLTPEQIADRIARYHTPYWSAVMDTVRTRLDADPEVVVLHLSIHSFTPEYGGRGRPMSIGVMYDPGRLSEDRFGQAVTDRLNERGTVAAINEPYDGRAPALVTSCRELFPSERYLGIEFEINQRHVGDFDPIADALLDAVCHAMASWPEA